MAQEVKTASEEGTPQLQEEESKYISDQVRRNGRFHPNCPLFFE